MKTASSRPRGAFTLIELVAVMIVSSMSMGLAVWTLAAVLRQGSRASEQFHDETELDRLSRQFRKDVRRAAQVTIGNQGRNLRLSFEVEGGKLAVEYRFGDKGGIERVQSGTTAARTSYAVHCDADRSRFVDRTAEGIVSAELVAAPQSNLHLVGAVRTIEAAVAADGIHKAASPKAEERR